MSDFYKVGNLIYDAEIYDGMNGFLSDLDFYQKWLSDHKDAKILELCCGTGRLTIPLAKAGLDIIGVDFTSTMLEHAKSKAKSEGLAIDFIEADMRSLNLPDSFDIIFIPFNSIHHLYTNADLSQTLAVVKKHLSPSGTFILDCFNPNIEFLVEGSKAQKTISEYTTKDGRDVLIKENMHYESDSQINRIEWHYFINGQFHSTQKLDMRMFFPKELDSRLEWNGFKIIRKFGSFEETQFDSASEKQIFICEPK
ncbi:class I SAM-dependent methyltransferase [Psychroserpens sp.]|uniref:class I SAM-dependent methyltransferase n=1 Tax=Psychroserpens sp. TaxID=2020870 RepID=UPI001B124FB1|nr:class I SAM-dependent methyltransferase [Psychroserpens sp.]MBO6606100.1 class I SAM-dependent methyltransferase [Psychroserpens sp.]MBO6630608.1 class I SAM-dependent methyltransferase [Psychroserpens sp.]MBO6652529.1 class I SAM-dependent methyltransferase [Psychroserpens sp.]MBO6681699.1 class I SAM-dependent methyltransferase [Psychroserpens sp.]MBO6749474.1 class I SAM-dependent methyltransferase [Psychroserpens sp.]